MSKHYQSVGLVFAGIVFLLYLTGRLVGADVTGGHWSFTHWQFLPKWYPFFWLALVAAITSILWRYSDVIGARLDASRLRLGALSALFLMLLVFRLDSFLFGGGNLRVAQLAQADRIIIHWYEAGSIAVVAGLFHIFNFLGMADNTASVVAWRVFAYGCTALSLWAAARLAGALTENPGRRLLLFIIGFFGPQTLLYLCFIGIEPVVIPVTLWFGYFILRLSTERSSAHLLAIWTLVVIGAGMHITLLYLLPAAVFMTVAHLWSTSLGKITGTIIALLLLAGLVAMLYHEAAASLRLSARLLFLHGKPPFTDYGVFSLRHIADLLGLLFLTAPVVIVIKFLAFMDWDWWRQSSAGVAFWLTALGGTIVMIVTNPTDSIVLDAPRLIAYAAPYSLLSILILARGRIITRSRLLHAVAVLAIAAPLAYVPTYRSLAAAERYVSPYLDEYPTFWRTGTLALRDAWFYSRNMKKANEWKDIRAIKSPDFLNLRGCRDLIAGNRIDDAVPVLYRMIARQPYWPQPRALLASALIAAGRFAPAKAQIDTCLLLNPHDPQHYRNLGRYYHAIGQDDKAVEVLERARKDFPHDTQMAVLDMTYRYFIHDGRTADSLASVLIAIDSTLPDPYLIKGWLADRAGDYRAAINFYRRFLTLAPRDPDAAQTKERLQALQRQIKPSP